MRWRSVALSAAVGVAFATSACATTSGYQDGGPGRAYIVDSHNWVVASQTTVWSCDATTGSPQCWRVVERE